MEFPADEALTVGEGHLVDKNNAVFAAGYDISPTWWCVDPWDLPAMGVDGLLDDVIEDWVEDL